MKGGAHSRQTGNRLNLTLFSYISSAFRHARSAAVRGNVAGERGLQHALQAQQNRAFRGSGKGRLWRGVSLRRRRGRGSCLFRVYVQDVCVSAVSDSQWIPFLGLARSGGDGGGGSRERMVEWWW